VDFAQPKEVQAAPAPLLICIKAADSGMFVALFAVLGEILEPKRFAGTFGAPRGGAGQPDRDRPGSGDTPALAAVQ
jgi:hypothetical protein